MRAAAAILAGLVLFGGCGVTVIAGSMTGGADSAAYATATSCDGSTPALAAAGAGFTGPNLPIAKAVALAESGGDPLATHLNANGTTDYGMWQINSIHTAILASGDWRNPPDNARMAYAVWQTSGWQAWTTYRTGAYLEYLTGCADTPTPTGPGAAAAVAWALAHLGVPYVWGGNSPTAGMDCSSYTRFAWAAAGVNLPRTAAEQLRATIPIPPGQEQPGDLVFSEFAPDGAHHVQLVVEAGNPGTVAEEPHTPLASMLSPYRESGPVTFGRPRLTG